MYLRNCNLQSDPALPDPALPWDHLSLTMPCASTVWQRETQRDALDAAVAP
jgi:hypothetical protein